MGLHAPNVPNAPPKVISLERFAGRQGRWRLGRDSGNADEKHSALRISAADEPTGRRWRQDVNRGIRFVAEGRHISSVRLAFGLLNQFIGIRELWLSGTASEPFRA
jgi:hypothetical protein